MAVEALEIGIILRWNQLHGSVPTPFSVSDCSLSIQQSQVPGFGHSTVSAIGPTYLTSTMTQPNDLGGISTDPKVDCQNGGFFRVIRDDQ